MNFSRTALRHRLPAEYDNAYQSDISYSRFALSVCFIFPIYSSVYDPKSCLYRGIRPRHHRQKRFPGNHIHKTDVSLRRSLQETPGHYQKTLLPSTSLPPPIHQIYLKDIIRAVFSIEDATKEEIIKFLGKENIETNCLLNNPLGKDCDLLFNNAIEYAIKLKEKGDTTNVK